MDEEGQVTAEKTAWLEVVAQAQSDLGSPRARARYDRTIALEAEEAFVNWPRSPSKDSAGWIRALARP